MKSKSESDKIEGGSYLGKYFTQFPNIIDEANLDPFEFRVLIHYYRVGDCWEGVRTTARKCRMSMGKISQIRKSLEDKGFITINDSSNGGGVTIRVVNKARENVIAFDDNQQWTYNDYLKARTFGINGTVCVYCGSTQVGPLDHVHPKSLGGTDDSSNLMPSCFACNRHKGKLLESEFIAILIKSGLLTDTRSLGEHVHHNGVGVHDTQKTSSPGEHKNNPSKNNPLRIDYAKLASQVLAIFNIVDKRYSPSSHGCKVTDERKNLIKNRESEFKKLWPDADFLKSCEFVFDYKAKEWVYTDQWKYFEIETIFARKHFIQYCEQAKKNKGTPPQSKKINGHQKSEQPITAKPSNWDKVESK